MTSREPTLTTKYVKDYLDDVASNVEDARQRYVDGDATEAARALREVIEDVTKLANRIEEHGKS